MQLEKMAAADNPPWLHSALSQLRDLENHGRDVPGIGDLRISNQTASRARLALSVVNVIDLPAPVVSPVSGGSVSIIWSLGEKEVKFAFYSDGGSMYFTSADDEVVDEGPVNFAEPGIAAAALQWMLQPIR